MIASLRTWLLGVVLTAFAAGIAQKLVPKGREQAVVRLVSGLLLTIALLRPFSEISWDTVSIEAGNFRRQYQLQEERYRTDQHNTLCAIIAEKTEAYIWDKATGLGLSGEVSVQVTDRESGIPLPDMVWMNMPYHPTLSVWLEEVVGIPAEKQNWLEGSP